MRSTIFGASWSSIKIGLSLKRNHHSQVRLVQTHGRTSALENIMMEPQIDSNNGPLEILGLEKLSAHWKGPFK